MAFTVYIEVRFENPPEEQALCNLIEDKYEDAIVVEYQEEEC